MRTEHHAVRLADVDDAVLSLDGHPAQLDVLRLRRAHARVFLDKGREVVRAAGTTCCTAEKQQRTASVGVSYLQVVDEQLIEGGVGVKVDQETLVVHHSDPGGLQGDAQALQLPLTLLQGTMSI